MENQMVMPCWDWFYNVFFGSPACLQSNSTGLGKCMKMYQVSIGFWDFDRLKSSYPLEITYPHSWVMWKNSCHLPSTVWTTHPKDWFFIGKKGKHTCFSWGKHETNTIQWPIQEPKLEVPTTYCKVYVKEYTPQHMAKHMVLTYLQFRVLKIPLKNIGISWPENVAFSNSGTCCILPKPGSPSFTDDLNIWSLPQVPPFCSNERNLFINLFKWQGVSSIGVWICMVVYSLPHDVASRRRRNIEGVQACPLGRPTKPSDWLFWMDFSLCNYPFAAPCCLNNYQHLPPSNLGKYGGKTQQNHHFCGCFEPSPNGRVYVIGFPTRALGLQSSFRTGVAKEDPASLEKNVMWETLAAINPVWLGMVGIIGDDLMVKSDEL